MQCSALAVRGLLFAACVAVHAAGAQQTEQPEDTQQERDSVPPPTPPSPPTPPTPPPMDTSFAGTGVVQLTDLNFRENVGRGGELWLVFFYFAGRCPLCAADGAHLISASAQLQGSGTPVRIGAVDVDEYQGLAKRFAATGRDLKSRGSRAEGPRPLLKVFDVAEKLSVRRGLYDAPELQDVAPGLATALTAPALIAYAQGALLNGRSAEQLQTALEGESVRVELPSVGDLLRQAQEDLVAGKPSGPVLGLAGLAGYILLSCFLCAAPPPPAKEKKCVLGI